MVPERAHKPGDRANRPGAGRSRLFRHPRLAALAFGLVLAGVVLALAEGGLRLAGFGGYAPTFRAAGRLDDGSTLVMTDPGGTASYFFADRPGSGALDPEALVRPKPAGTVRVMWVGESAAKGIPQPRPLRAASFLRAMLADAWPDRRVEVINLGAPAIASYPVLGVMREALEHEPDLVVAYLGNNEYYGAFGVSSVHSAGRSPGLIRALRALHSTAVAQALTRAAGRRAGTGTLMEAMAGRSSLGPDDPARAAAARTLGAFVGDMIDRCRERGVPIVVCTPPCNERDVAPFGEPDLSALAPGERGRLADLMRVAAESVADEPSRAEEAARAALHLHGTHATARFLLGRALLAQGREEEARVELRLAVDLDPMPWRPPAASVAAIRRAAESRGAGLADLESAFRAASPGGVVGWDLMDDHVHPSLKGQRGSGPGPVDPRYGHRSDRPAANNPPVSIVGHGVDIVAVERIGRMVAEHGERFLSRVFTAKERAYAQGKARGAEHLAARFAAKEAAFKALGTGWRDGIAWTDVGVEHDAMGRPMLVVRGRAAEVARARGVARWWVTLSHTAGTAVASVIAEGA